MKLSKPFSDRGNQRTIEIDKTVRKIIIKADASDLLVEDDFSRRMYQIKRSPKKFGLQMTSNSDTG